MNLQLDIFGAGETDSLPPWLDPAVCVAYRCRVETDRDHVGAAEIGRVGNNAPCLVVTAENARGDVLHAWRFDAAHQLDAYDFLRAQEAKLSANQQGKLL